MIIEQEKQAIKHLKLVDMNNKKHCQCMIEVNFAPEGVVKSSVLEKTIFVVTWEDGSQAEYKMVDLIRFKLHYISLSYIYTWQSHGMDPFDYIEWLRKQNPEVNSETKMACYFYQKVIH